MPERARLNHNGQQVTLVGPTVEDSSVWIAERSNGGVVYLSAETIAAALGSVPPYTPVTADLAAAPAEPEAPAAPAAAPATEPERPACPACQRPYTGTLGTEHRCERIKQVSCLNCRVADTEALADPPLAGLICARCASQGHFICKHCGRAKQGSRMPDVCDSCNPLQANDIWVQGIKAIGNDVTVLTRCHRPFAVEVESFRDPSRAETEGRVSGLVGWHRGSDGSIHPDEGCTSPTEWRSPPFRGDAGLRQLVADIEVIRKGGFRANDSCGLHVHIDMSDTNEEERQALHKFGKWVQAGMFKLVAASRANNTFCKKLTSYDTDKSDKYRWLSIQSYSRHRTVEFRLHHGITQPDIVAEWVKLCLRVVDRGMKLGNLSSAPSDSLFTLLGLTEYEKRFWSARAKKLHGRDMEVA